MRQEEQPYLAGRCRWCGGPMWLMPDGHVTGPYPVEDCLCEQERYEPGRDWRALADEMNGEYDEEGEDDSHVSVDR